MVFQYLASKIVPYSVGLILLSSACASTSTPAPRASCSLNDPNCKGRVQREQALRRLEERVSTMACVQHFVEDVCYDPRSSLYNNGSQTSAVRDIRTIPRFPQMNCHVGQDDKKTVERIVSSVKNGYDAGRAWFGVLESSASADSDDGLAVFVNSFFMRGCVQAQAGLLEEVEAIIKQAKENGIIVPNYGHDRTTSSTRK
ncbi:hypothetical protein HY772_00405 [Candidatus Woesearchaeota archaeon]|nr:hypothetical protein [Candidatus Woesearchaeota archaeon]